MEYAYDLAVIGAGTAGLAAALAADELGVKVALIEANKVGGENLWGAGIAARTLTRSAKVYDLLQRAEEFGVHAEKPRVIWNAVQLRIADVRDEIRAKQRAQLKASKIEVISGHASFVDAHTLEVSGRQISADRIVIATGSQPVQPEVAGLAEAGPTTPDAIVARKTLPRSIGFLGGSAIACELGQAFKRLGASVTLLLEGEQLLPDEDPAISTALETLLRNEGIEIHLQCRLLQAGTGDPRKWIEFETSAGPGKVEAGELVLSGARLPNFAGLNLEAAGLTTENGRLTANEARQTGVSHIFVAGEARQPFRSNRVAEWDGKIAAIKSQVGRKIKTPRSVTNSWVTFTDPEVAHLGLTQAEAIAAHGTARVFQVPFKTLDRAIIEGETGGFAQIVTTESGQIVGAHIIGHNAGELISIFVPAIEKGAQVTDLDLSLYPYPTFGEITGELTAQWTDA